MSATTTVRVRCGSGCRGEGREMILSEDRLRAVPAAFRAMTRLPGHGARGRRSRRRSPDLLAAIPALAVIVDTLEQRVQRPRGRTEADRYYSGKKKQHTLKAQIATDRGTGKVVDVPDSVCGPPHDLALLKASGLLDRLAPDVGALGD